MKSHFQSCLLLACSFGLSAQTVPAKPEPAPYSTPEDVKQGERLFLGQCAGCHGPRGEGGRGAVLAQPKLRVAVDDNWLAYVIGSGIYGTEMPASDTLNSREIWQVAAYVRSLGRLAPEPIPGDPQKGREIYRGKGNCTLCHTIDGHGGSLGPELSAIGVRRSAVYLREAILDPDKSLPEGFMRVRLVTKGGRQVSGARINEDTFTLQLRDLNGGFHSVLKQDLKELRKEEGKSTMPGYKETLSAPETDDLVAYLMTLGGKP